MLASLSTIALLVSWASAAAADNRSRLPITHVRNLGLRVINDARSKAKAKAKDRSLRKTQEGDMGMDMGNMGELLCGMLSMFDTDSAEFKQAMASEEGVECSQFGCDAANENLLMTCTMEGPFCEEDDGQVEYCIESATVEMSMELDFENESSIKSKQCSTYTKPEELADLEEGCFVVHVTMDYGGMMEAAMNADPNMSEEEAAQMGAQFVQIDECSGSFADGTGCECGACDDGLGFELTCRKDGAVTFTSEECADFDVSSFTDVAGEGGPGVPAASIIMLSAAQSDAQPPQQGTTGTTPAPETGAAVPGGDSATTPAPETGTAVPGGDVATPAPETGTTPTTGAGPTAGTTPTPGGSGDDGGGDGVDAMSPAASRAVATAAAGFVLATASFFAVM